MKRIIYYSDGAKQHFKNRFQIANLMNHETDFGVPADWHFHATAHGKNACDGIGATFKREATRASLQASSLNPLTNANVLFEWAQKNFSTIQIRFYSNEMHRRAERHLKKRFTEAKPVPNISTRHGFITLQNKDILIKIYSNASNGEIFKYTQ